MVPQCKYFCSGDLKISFVIIDRVRMDLTSHWLNSYYWTFQHSVPEQVYKKINSSEVWCIFLKTKLYDNSKKCSLKNHSKCLKWQFPLKISTFSPFWGFRGKIAVLRHLEGFLEKSEESRPPLKLKNNGGLLSAIFF